MFSKKAIKIEEIFTFDLTVKTEDFVKFCNLLRKHKLYLSENSKVCGIQDFDNKPINVYLS